tara:strand:+ start:609 stop:785 length:177 start_codon:yes stop_codon:yes gene_type:complete
MTKAEKAMEKIYNLICDDIKSLEGVRFIPKHQRVPHLLKLVESITAVVNEYNNLEAPP